MSYDGIFGIFFFLNISTDRKQYCASFYITVQILKKFKMFNLYKKSYFYLILARMALQNGKFLVFGVRSVPKF